MKKKSAILALLLAGVLSLGVVASGCKKPQEPENPDDQITKPNDQEQKPSDEEQEKPVVLSEDTAIALTKGASKELSASAGATWASDSPNVATVDGNGKVTAKAAGVAKVTATTTGSVITCTVIVQDTLPSSSQATAKDPFKFNNDGIDIGSVDISGSGPVESDPDAEEYTVKFSDGVAMQYVANGSFAVEPVAVEKSGNYLQGWYSDAGYQTKFDFGTAVTQNYNLYAKWGTLPSGMELAQGNFESIALEWSGSAEGATVSYKPSSSGTWKQIDSQLIRDNGGSVRADVVGLSAGEYDVKVNTGSGEKLLENITVKKYDRSGYAHFNYTEGVGAYKDDGTLKDDALVIYVTDENKNTVMDEVCAANSDVKMFAIPGSDWEGKNASGIGWWLNNNQYTTSNEGSKKNKQPSNTYDKTNGGKLGFKSVNRPIVIRFIGTVTTPEGCTAYNDTKEGGGIGDNGHMARLKNLKNVTLEGIGEDAEIRGWGFHFVAGTDAVDGQGKSFEVRNLIFNEYPEDAIGMEGQATSTTITAPVERCWIHNNTFLPGRCDNPAESDKKEGDGSCDFKRGMYFTCSYNYFEYCHKTNLVGSADDSLQFNMTYHHNMWYQCGSRIPLTRQANVHFYNNYVYGDATEKTTPYSHIAKPSLSYVHSLRASCYLFSEANYYDGTKNTASQSAAAKEGETADKKIPGEAKGWGNIYYSTSEDNAIIDTKTRTDAISNNCHYVGGNVNFNTFDTDKNLFYYDETNKKTDVELLDDAVSARIRAVMYSGALGHGKEYISRQNIVPDTPKGSVTVAESGTTINLAGGKAGTEAEGVLYCGTFAGKSGKGKGTLAVFTLTAEAMVTVTGTGAVSDGSDNRPQLVRLDGKVFAEKFDGTVRVVLPAGTYAITAGLKDKEATVTELKFENTAASADARKTAAREALEAIPQKITRSSGDVIAAAGRAYSGLLADEKAEFAELYQRYLKAVAAYDNISVEYVIERIKYIGTVTPASKSDIDAAEKAYNALSADAKSKVTNRDTLIAAQAEFEQFAVQSVKDVISVLPAVSDFNKIVDSKPAIELALEIFNKALDQYELLEDEQKKEVSVTDINSAILTLTAALRPYDVKDMIAALDETAADYITKVGALKTAYEALTTEQQKLITTEEKAVYDKAIEAYTEYASQAKVAIFTKTDLTLASEAGFTVNGKKGYKGTSDKFTYNGTEYSSPLKLQDGDTVTFSTASAMKVTIMLHTGKGQTVYLDGTKYTAENGLIVIDNLPAGDHVIGRDKEAWLCYVELTPAK